MKHFIIICTYLVSWDELAQVIEEHRAYLQTGYDKGWLLFSGPQVPKTGGAIIARAPSREDIEAFLAADVFPRKGVAKYQVIEIEPMKRQAFMDNWLTGK